MPSQKTASKQVKPELIKCQVMRAIGIDATSATLISAKNRAARKGLSENMDGLTTMVHPNKDVPSEDKKSMVKGEPVYIDLEKEVARKLSEAGAVRVVI